ncbi:uncharacterized protein [Spinacia oleracea]|uniref:Uncharacterized protein isoform X2 n=1 Tax=Spinacia oleracea TaxID=3562 RepID=A0ABM3R0T9_SPIOL|nr:uncharacterized protein LOC110789692 isoform X2 [Spinacia oleracea]
MRLRKKVLLEVQILRLLPALLIAWTCFLNSIKKERLGRYGVKIVRRPTRMADKPPPIYKEVFNNPRERPFTLEEIDELREMLANSITSECL